MAQASFKRGLQYLLKSRSTEGDKENVIRVSSLLIRLAGTSTAARAFIGAIPKEKKKFLEFYQGQELLKWNVILKTELRERSFRGTLPENALETATIVRFVHGVLGELKFWDDLKIAYGDGKFSASVDSELTLILSAPYQLARWLPNPFHENYLRNSPELTPTVTTSPVAQTVSPE